jgi:predicted nuclease with TOPRIM domain
LVGSSARVAPKVAGAPTTLNAKAKTTGVADTERLAAIGKNLIRTKSMTQQSNVQPSSVENSDLLRRVENLENKMGEKQDTLEAGNGIEFDGNIIGLTEEMAALPEKVTQIDEQISDLNDKVDIANLSSNYYTIGQTQDYLEQNYYTKAYVDSIVSQLSGANVVSQFNPSFLHQNTGN